jgi:hypothetical protein
MGVLMLTHESNGPLPELRREGLPGRVVMAFSLAILPISPMWDPPQNRGRFRQVNAVSWSSS